MKTRIVFVIALLVAASGAAHIEHANFVSATLQSLPRDGWVAYELPSDGRETMCCFDWQHDNALPMTCRLGRSNNMSMGRMDPPARIDTSTMIVALRREGGIVRDVEVYSGGCRVDAGGATVNVINDMTVDESLDLLVPLHNDRAMQAIAMHKSPRVAAILETWASEKNASDDFRGNALFWLAQVGGRRGFEVARRFANDDPDRELRKKAVFALTQSSDPEVFDALTQLATKHKDAETRSEAVFWLGQEEKEKALPVLRDRVANDASWEVREKAIFAIGQVPGEDAAQLLATLARHDHDSRVRKEALFWLGQVADRKLSVLLDAADHDPDSAVREMAVFAISQRPADEAIPQLVQLARTHRDPAVRKKAVFWLSQMDDPRAVDAIEKIVLH